MTAPLRIAMLSNLYPPLSTGSAVQSSGLARELALLGHEVVVFTARIVPDAPEHEVTTEGVHIYRLPCLKLPRLPISMNFEWLNSLLRPSNLDTMAAICRERGIQVLHIHNHMFDAALCGMLLARKLDLPSVVTLHTVIQHAKAVYNAALYPLDKFFLGSCVVRRADAVICPDCTVDKYLVSRFRRKDGVIIPYGIALPPAPRAAAVEALREEWSLEDKRVILSMGHMHALRNRMELIRAFGEVHERHPDARLVIVGSRGYPPAEALVRDLNLEDVVVFTGTQPYATAAVFHAMAYCEAAWLDQNNMASAGVACLEAMYYGKAVVTACPEDTHEEGGLRNGQNVLILPRPVVKDAVRKALLTLLDSPGLCSRMGEQAAAFVASYFSWDNAAGRHIALYERLIAGKGAPV